MHGDIMGFRESMMDQYHSTEGSWKFVGPEGAKDGLGKANSFSTAEICEFSLEIFLPRWTAKIFREFRFPNFLRLDQDKSSPIPEQKVSFLQWRKLTERVSEHRVNVNLEDVRK